MPNQSFDMSAVKEVKWHDKDLTFNVCDLQIDGVSIWKCNTGAGYYLKNGDAGGPIVSAKTGVEKSVAQVMEERNYGLRVAGSLWFYVLERSGNPYYVYPQFLSWQLGRSERQSNVQSSSKYITLRNRLVSELNREILSTRLPVNPYPYANPLSPYYPNDPDQDPWLNW